ncbi:MAG TPA: amino acid ABC transporter substrate-binding protein [Chromatiales bacterium]|nr:amino acid ABC transporter substrate-binding protein [Chromatiales bacterium]
MLHTFFRITLLVLLVLVMSTAPLRAGDDKVLKLASSSWPPYADKTMPEKGFGIDMVSQILKRAGYTTEITIASWPRVLQGTSIGIYDAIPTAWYTPERDKMFHFSEPYFENVIRLVKLKDRPIKARSLADLKGLLVGYVTDYAYGEAFNKATNIVKLPSNHVIQNLMLLQRGKIDLTLGDRWVIRYELTNYMPNSIKDFEFIGKPVTKRKLHLAISRSRPDHEQIAAAFNKALKEMKADGSYEKILDKYRSRLAPLVESPL